LSCRFSDTVASRIWAEKIVAPHPYAQISTDGSHLVVDRGSSDASDRESMDTGWDNRPKKRPLARLG
jgi:hypothetical protein